jgi:Transposase DDE domain
VFACSLSIPRSGPPGKAIDQELIALAVAQAVTGLVSDRQFLGTIGRLLPGCFPQLPGQPQLSRRLRRLTPQITRVQLGLAELVASGDVRLVDGTLLSCANYAGCAARSEFAGAAAYGYCAAKSRWYWGVRLLLVSDRRGTPLGYDLRPANENEREGVFALACAHPGSRLFADAGHRGREHQESLQLVGVELIVPARHRLGERPPAEVSKARIRLVIDRQAAHAPVRLAAVWGLESLGDHTLHQGLIAGPWAAAARPVGEPRQTGFRVAPPPEGHGGQ